MTPAWMGLGGLVVLSAAAIGGALAGATLPQRFRAPTVGLLTALVGAGSLLAGAGALAGRTATVTVPGLVPLSSAQLTIDALSGVFMVIVGGVAIIAALYSAGYTARSTTGDPRPATGPASRTTQAMLPVFVASMALVTAAANVTTFLVLWELMALSSLLLVLSEHRSRPAVRDAGLWYAGMTHAGLVTILLALATMAAGAGSESFESLRTGSAHLSPGVRSAVFLLALVGFGSKAGMVPLHVWLPRAHPEAPSHVSALMSAAMVTMGLYGLVRVWFDLLGGGPTWWGTLVLGLGALSALYGVLQASVCEDLKRLLAYSTTENLGLMFVGIGAAGMFAAQGSPGLAGLLMAAALLHAINHAAFKSLLFLGAGSVLRATGLRGLDAMGGLARRMPVTTASVGVGALCAAALPPGNGFVSEWLLLQGLIHSFSGPDSTMVVAIAMPLTVGVVALTGGLAVMTFVKLFGVGFLARPRSAQAAQANESPVSMRLAMGLAGLACVGLALVPSVASEPLARVLAVLPTMRGADPLGGGVTLRLSGITGSMSPLMIAGGVVVGAAMVGVLIRGAGRRQPAREADLWACGGGRLTPRMEYTATSFAEPLGRVFDDVLRPEQDVDVTHHAESRYLLESVRFRQRVPDRLEARVYPPLLAAVRRCGQAATRLQNGSVHRYLGYGLTGVLAVLVVVGLTS